VLPALAAAGIDVVKPTAREVAAAAGRLPLPRLEHYFAPLLLISAGVDVKVVQTRMRHASAKTNSRYPRPPLARFG
jgi:site-specific recombinase XerD